MLLHEMKASFGVLKNSFRVRVLPSLGLVASLHLPTSAACSWLNSFSVVFSVYERGDRKVNGNIFPYPGSQSPGLQSGTRNILVRGCFQIEKNVEKKVHSLDFLLNNTKGKRSQRGSNIPLKNNNKTFMTALALHHLTQQDRRGWTQVC